jgi:hypothetical protein
MKAHGELGRRRAHIRQFQQKIALPEAAIVFAVGGEAKTHILLHPHRLANRFVLNSRQIGGGDFTLFRRLPRANERVGPDQASDMLGAEWWLRARRHGSFGA